MTWPPSGLPVPQNWTDATVAATVHANAHNTVGAALDAIVTRVDETALPAWFTTTDAPNTATLQATVAQVADGTQPILNITDDVGGSMFRVLPNAWELNARSTKCNASVGTPDDGSLQRTSTNDFYAESETGEFVDSYIRSRINYDGTGRDGCLDIECDLDGEVNIRVGDSAVRAFFKGHAGQTTPLLELQDSASVAVFSIAPDGKVGGTTPNDGDQLTWDATSGTIQWKGPLV